MATFEQTESNGTIGSAFINSKTRAGVKCTGDSFAAIKNTSGDATVQFYLKGDSTYDITLTANYYDESGVVVTGADPTTVTLTSNFEWHTFNISGTVPGNTHCYIMLTDPNGEGNIISSTYWDPTPPPPTNYDNELYSSTSASGIPTRAIGDHPMIKFTAGTPSASGTRDPPPPFNMVSL